jgi:protein TonB
MTGRPEWLRPLALCLVLALHATLLLAIKRQPSPFAPLATVEVTLEPLGDSAADQPKMDEIIPAEPPLPTLSSPVEPSELTAPPPKIVAPESVPLPVEKPRPVIMTKPKRVVEDRPKREVLRAQATETAERRKARTAQQAVRRGVAEASNGFSGRNYAGMLAAELRRQQFYPAEARTQGATGSVGVAFSVGPSGRVVSQSITRSSGNAALDGAARAMMGAVHAPPPPGGQFSTSTTIRFHLD